MTCTFYLLFGAEIFPTKFNLKIETKFETFPSRNELDDAEQNFHFDGSYNHCYTKLQCLP